MSMLRWLKTKCFVVVVGVVIYCCYPYMMMMVLNVNNSIFDAFRELPEADLGLLQHPRWMQLQDVNYYHKVLHLGCCSSPRSASGYSWKCPLTITITFLFLFTFIKFIITFSIKYRRISVRSQTSGFIDRVTFECKLQLRNRLQISLVKLSWDIYGPTTWISYDPPFAIFLGKGSHIETLQPKEAQNKAFLNGSLRNQCIELFWLFAWSKKWRKWFYWETSCIRFYNNSI